MYQPIINKNPPWWPCLVSDKDKIKKLKDKIKKLKEKMKKLHNTKLQNNYKINMEKLGMLYGHFKE